MPSEPKLKQKKPELWWRWPTSNPLLQTGWAFTLYVAHPDGTIEGHYNKSISGKSYEYPRWDAVNFERNVILENEYWEFICEM